MTSNSENIPTIVIWKRPIRIQRPPSVDNIPFYEKFVSLFHPPIFHFRIRQEILKEFKRIQDRLKIFNGSLFPVDVVFSASGFEKIQLYYSQYQSDVILRELGRWLTEQVTAGFLDQSDKKTQWPDIVVRCILAKGTETTYFENLRQLRLTTLSWMKNLILNYAPGIDLREYPYYYVRFPKSIEHAEIKLEFTDLISPTKPVLEWFNQRIQPFKTLTLPIEPDKDLYPLVDEDQVKLTLVKFPDSYGILLYAQQSGRHESWVYNGPSDENITKMGGWVNIPRDGWMPIRTGNILVLGRMANTKLGARIVPGSMVIRIEYHRREDAR
jgi:hypothetical protein